MQKTLWYFLKDPIFPELDGNGDPFKVRKIYYEIIDAVKANPGLTGTEIAKILGKPPSSVDTFIWKLRKYCGALEARKVGYEKLPGIDEFARTPCIAKMLDKIGSEGTKRPWLRRMFAYQKWLKEKGYFESITELLDDFRNAKTDDLVYRHIDLIEKYVNSWKASKATKAGIVKVIRGFYRKNRVELPKEKITFSKENLSRSLSAAEEFVKPDEVWRIIQDGRVPVRDKAVIAVLLTMGLDESTFVNQFNIYAYPQLVKALGDRPESWDIDSRVPVRIDLLRPKTGTTYFGFLPKKALLILRDWLMVRNPFSGSSLKIFRDEGLEKSEPVFVSKNGKPLDENAVRKIVRESSFKSGVQQREIGTKRYRIHGHELRDTFKTTCRIAGVEGAVSEFFLGHSIDALGYDKSPWVYPEHFRAQYAKLEPFICGEGQAFIASEQKRKELEARISDLESLVSALANNKAKQILARDDHIPGSDNDSNRSVAPQFKKNDAKQTPIHPDKLDEFLEKGFRWEANLPDGRILVCAT